MRSLYYDIQNFIDGNQLVAPNLVPFGVQRASDNGPMFTSEYLIMRNRYITFSLNTSVNYYALLNCIVDRELRRAPNDLGHDEIDDHLGVLAFCAEFSLSLPLKLPLRLWRFPQLVYAYCLMRGIPSLLMFPLALINAAIIGLSCIGIKPSSADPRRLNWLLLQATKRKSLMARIAGVFWFYRQKKVYNVTSNVMRSVAAYYYKDNHPFISYWID